VSTPTCERASELRALDGRRLRLVGIYRPVPTLKKMPRPGGPREEVELGEVVIELEGSASEFDRAMAEGEPARVALGTELRPTDEIARLRNRRVAVEGRLALAGPVAAQGAAQRPAPTLLDPGEPVIAD
jgi:hypothetical protein